MRKTKVVVTDKIEGVSTDIPNHFGNIDKELSNSMKDGHQVKLISEEVNSKISGQTLSDVNKVIKKEVKKTAAALKAGKSDPVYTFLLLQQTAVQSSILILSCSVNRISQTCLVVKK